jgi:sec-independent protein translocase protein TatA
MFEIITNFIPQGGEIVIIVIVIGVLIFGAKKIPELAKTFGKAKGEFEKGKIEGDKELKEFKGEIGSKDKETKSD